MPLTINAPDVERRLQQEATRQGISAGDLALQLLNAQLPTPQDVTQAMQETNPSQALGQEEAAVETEAALPFYATATAEEWEQEFRRWVDSHKDMNLPQLPPEAYERASFYEDERHLNVSFDAGAA